MVIPELVDKCNLKCALCWNRNRKGSDKQMSLKTIEKVISVFGPRANYHWYNWGEPLLYRHFHEFIEIAKTVRTSLSSNLSLTLSDQMIEDIAKIEQITVSISGLTKEVYNLYHKGGNFDIVMKNIMRLKGLPKVRINWIKHCDNAHQKRAAYNWCVENGFIWGGLECNCEVEERVKGFDHPYLKPERHYGGRHMKECRIRRWVPISTEGHYLLCCTSHNVKTGYTIWDNITPEELIQIKSEIPLCKKCSEKELWRMF